MRNIGDKLGNQNSNSTSNKCPECNGMGWIRELVLNDYHRKVYGREHNIPTECWKECPRCKGNNLQAISDLTGVPACYRDADMSKFKWNIYSGPDIEYIKKIRSYFYSFWQDFDKWCKEGKGLYLWSKTSGSGKTFIACCISKSVMMRHDIKMRFITAPDYFALLAERMKQERGDFDKTQVYRTCTLLVLDDLGTTPNKEWYEMELFKLIDARMSNGLITIFTSNIPMTSMKCNDRIIDRINKGSLNIHFPEQSIRREIDEKNTENFLRKMELL